MPSLKLYYHPVSPPARACYWAVLANNSTADVDFCFVDVTKGEQNKPEFLALNPYHTVPTLHDEENGLILTEGAAILQYLAEKLNWTKVTIPRDDIIVRYKAENYFNFHHEHSRVMCHEIMKSYCRPMFVPGSEPDFDAVRAGIAKAESWLVHFDKAIEKNGGYITGDKPTLADIFAHCELSLYVPGDKGFNLYDYNKFPNVKKWIEDVKVNVPEYEKGNEAVAGFVAAAKTMSGEFKN